MQKCLKHSSVTGSTLLGSNRTDARGVRCFQTGCAHRARTHRPSRSAGRPQITCQSQPKPVKAAAVQDRPDTKMSDVVKWGKDKRLQTQVLDVADETVSIRCLDWDRDRFDIEFGLQEGTTYNSYLIFGEKTALVDASHEKFRDLYMKTLKDQLSAQGRTLDYVIVSHTEPDHSGLIPDIIDAFPDVEIAGSKVALMYLKGLTNRDFTQHPVKGGDKIDLGKGHSLEFVMAPNLHWPDTMFSFDSGTGVLYTCDAFGQHYCHEEPFDTDLKAIEPHYRFYYDCLMKPNARSVLSALKRVKDMDYTTIAVGHGPLIRYNLSELVGRYQSWSEKVGKATASVAVLYSSDYGYSDRLSQTLARGITKAGAATEMVDVLSVDVQELVEIVGRSTGIALMAPPADSDTAQQTLNTLLSAVNKKQKVLIAESYGGRDEPVDTLTNNFVGVGVEPVLEAFRVREVPDEATYQGIEEAGTRLAQVLTKKESIAKMKASMPPDVAKALARVSGGLYVVAAVNNTARGAMLASWVAQASFEPLGLTVAVAKDRAIESLMQVGGTFVLNCLEDGNYSTNMKHFLKRFPPGADRLSGIDWSPANNGSPVLESGINAYMECKVVSRMETADHWLTYCEVTDGAVVNGDKKTAIHRRKVANYY